MFGSAERGIQAAEARRRSRTEASQLGGSKLSVSAALQRHAVVLGPWAHVERLAGNQVHESLDLRLQTVGVVNQRTC